MPVHVVNKINFAGPPAVGTVLLVDCQSFEVVGIKPHRRRDDTPTVLITWAGHCAACGRTFTQTTGLVAKTPNRRCPLHHAPGVPVNEASRRRNRIRRQRRRSTPTEA